MVFACQTLAAQILCSLIALLCVLLAGSSAVIASAPNVSTLMPSALPCLCAHNLLHFCAENFGIALCSCNPHSAIACSWSSRLKSSWRKFSAVCCLSACCSLASAVIASAPNISAVMPFCAHNLLHFSTQNFGIALAVHRPVCEAAACTNCRELVSAARCLAIAGADLCILLLFAPVCSSLVQRPACQCAESCPARHRSSPRF